MYDKKTFVVQHMTLGAFDCDKIDIISTEYNGNYLASTDFNTTGFPPIRYSGHAYSLLSASARSHNAVVWYYATKYPYTDFSGKIFGYEAFAYNCLLHNSFSGTGEKNTHDISSMDLLTLWIVQTFLQNS